MRDNLSLNKVPVYSDAEPDQQHQHNTEWRDCKIRRETGEATYKRGGETYKRGGTPGGEQPQFFGQTASPSPDENQHLPNFNPRRASTSHV